MYQLTNNQDIVVLIEGGFSTYIPKGHRLWEDYEAWIALGNVAKLPDEIKPSLKEIIEATDKAIEAWLDHVVKQQNYRSIESCISYRGDPEPRFAAQAEAAFLWRSAVYKAAALMLNNIPDGMDTPEEAIAALPQPEDYGWYSVPEIGPIGNKSVSESVTEV